MHNLYAATTISVILPGKHGGKNIQGFFPRLMQILSQLILSVSHYTKKGMNMKTFKFKTNLKCSNCVSRVKSQLDTAIDIVRWNIDLKNPERILTVETEQNDIFPTVQRILSEAGYYAETCHD